MIESLRIEDQSERERIGKIESRAEDEESIRNKSMGESEENKVSRLFGRKNRKIHLIKVKESRIENRAKK